MLQTMTYIHYTETVYDPAYYQHKMHYSLWVHYGPISLTLLTNLLNRIKESTLRVFTIEKAEYDSDLRNHQVYYLSNM